jgi:betaine-homocysteine S-methyltransferase
MPKGILERLSEGPVLGDGGYLLELEKRGYVQAGPFTPEVVIEHPEALAELHREFLRAGAEVLQTMTFYASDDKLATVGMEGTVDEINRNAVRIAREVASEGDALVAGNLSLTWAYDPSDPAGPDHVRKLFDRQLQDQIDAGPPDLWIGETFSYLGEALLFVERAKATGRPVMVTMSFETLPARVYEGDAAGEAAKKLADAGADIVGVNCLNGPAQQLPISAEMVKAVGGAVPVAAQPVAYATTEREPDFTSGAAFPYALTPMTLARGDLADFAVKARDAGVRYIGSCCGSVAEHVRAMAKVLGKLPDREREWRSPTGKAMSAYEYHEHTETEV